MKAYDVIVVGAGPAGMMAAGTAAERGSRVLLLERNDQPGRKLRITGKGRCNVTNCCTWEECVRATVTNGRFLFGALSRFTPQDTMAFFENLGVPLKTERGNRVFPVSDNASDIVDALVGFCRKSGVCFAAGRAERLLLEDAGVKGVQAGGSIWEAPRVVVACGGCSYPKTGSTGDGYRLARQAGHTIVEPKPSLVPLVSEDPDCGAMQGLSLRNCRVRVVDNLTGKSIYEDFGELLFTHFGLSGPVVLSAGSHIRIMERNRYSFLLDLKPALSPEKLDERLRRDLLENRNRNFENALGGLLPQKMIPVVVKRSGIPGDEKCHSVTREQRQQLLQVLKNFQVTIAAFRPIEEAIVTSGGVNVKEINPKTMESKKAAGLYFAGEVIDVDAYTGGFNLQIAFATGRLAGLSCLE